MPPDTARLYPRQPRPPRRPAPPDDIERLLAEKSVPFRSFDLRNSHTYLFVVATGDADTVSATLTGGKHGERDVVCEPSRK